MHRLNKFRPKASVPCHADPAIRKALRRAWFADRRTSWESLAVYLSPRDTRPTPQDNAETQVSPTTH